jgi:hypothetical protein
MKAVLRLILRIAMNSLASLILNLGLMNLDYKTARKVLHPDGISRAKDGYAYQYC